MVTLKGLLLIAFMDSSIAKDALRGAEFVLQYKYFGAEKRFTTISLTTILFRAHF